MKRNDGAIKAMHVLIDADACPVKDEAIELALRHGFTPVLVSNGGMRPSRYPDAEIVTVPAGADAADDRIVEMAGPGDVAITADVPLASRVLEKGAAAIGPTGRPFTPETIGEALSMRAFSQHLRESGEIKGYNASFSAADRSRFRQALDRALRGAKG
ncbi:hypothetical protein SAMN06297251_12129 [Fulvimarina manganoxydans]|uniref:UPF0178 protein SAMN06297251_12129 n=1 Tax=Fulvimarina manganoxydans TaxID=937218 RepID=A0A1W2E6Y0_9HYPH|nr:YaiI/YqxD family protein [Fulvimarina manganoxydans]SMD04808.1 hypothetical protein SAMN06297251_12129 [Fulvimarina manganoxydans]